MCLTLARLIDMHIPISYASVQKSSGRFSALQATKVLSTAELTRHVTKEVSKGLLASLQHDMHELFSASDIKAIKTQNEIFYSGKGRPKQPSNKISTMSETLYVIKFCSKFLLDFYG